MLRCIIEHLPDGLDCAFGRDNPYAGAIGKHEGIELEVEDDFALKKHGAVILVALKHHLRAVNGLCLNVRSLLTVGYEADGFEWCLPRFGHSNDILEERSRGEVLVFLERDIEVGNNSFHSVECQVEQSVIRSPRAEKEPAVAILLQQIRPHRPVLWLRVVEGLVADVNRMLVGDVVVEWIEKFQSREVGVALEVHDRCPLALGYGECILQSSDDIRQFGESIEVGILPEHVYGLGKLVVVVLRHRQLGDGKVGVGISIVFMVIDLYRRIVAEFVASHHLYVELYGAGGDAFSDTLKVVKGIRTGLDEVL